MLPLTYFFKVILCSAAFLGYYLIALRNKRFHQYNRFYLLFSVVASWLIPLIKFQVTTTPTVQQPIYQAFNYIVETNGAFELEPSQAMESSFDWMQLIPIAYATIAVTIFIAALFSALKIVSIYKKYPKQKNNNITFINTQESSTPFSFFNNIFWNTSIDANTSTGKQILQHELTHVNEKHSWDKIFMQLNIVFGWFNPCFWLIKSELEMIHEFIADNKAIANANAADFASMLLLATFPTHQHKLTNPFFFSPIKRRLIMLTQNSNPRLSYLRRLIVLPLLAIVVLLFAFRKKENTIANSLLKKVGLAINSEKKASDIQEENVPSNETTISASLQKKYKIVIDAGHGGSDMGATAIDGKTYEKDIALAIAKAIKEQNTNENIEIILTREDDHFDHVRIKADFSNAQKADLFVSIHCNDGPVDKKENKLSGTEIYVVSTEKNNGFMDASKILAQNVNIRLKQHFTNNGIKQRPVGIWVLQATNCPAILVETGMLKNRKDLAVLANPEQQNLMAKDILKGIENYLAQKESDKIANDSNNSTTGNLEKDTIKVVNLNGDVIETKIETKASDAELEEYDNIVKKYKDKTGKFKYNFSKISEEDNNRMMEIFSKMSKTQQEQLKVYFRKAPQPSAKAIPSAEQLNKWATNKVYGVWIDDGHQIANSQLLKYAPTDFSYFDISRLEKNAANYGKHYYQLNLMTNKYYKNYLEESKKKPYWIVWQMSPKTSAKVN